MKEIILLGAGGHAAVILDILNAQLNNGTSFKIRGLLDDQPHLKEWMNYPILGRISDAQKLATKNTEFIIAIGSNEIRQKIASSFKDLKYTSLAIHPSAIIGSNVKIMDGTVIMPRTVINANTTIGSHVIINTGAIVEHDNIIGDYVHLSPNATLCGGVYLEAGVHIGANATIIPQITIKKNTVIGAGSTVISNIEENIIAVGSPAKIIKWKDEV